MKRKVIQLAEKTFVVSLPSAWVRQWGVKKGEEIELTENGSKLTISTSQDRDLKKGSINITEATDRVVRWALSSLHKKGYDEIEIKTDKPEHARLIDELLKDLFIGFAIVHQVGNNCIIRALSRDLDDQFDIILRRSFLITLNLADATVIVASSQKDSSEILLLEKTNNQLTNFCERILNKRGHTDPVLTNFLYVIVWNLEKIADDYKYLAHAIEKRKPSKESIIVLQETNKLLRTYYELFYRFNIAELSKLSDSLKGLQEQIESIIPKNPDALLLSHISHIALKIADFSASTYAFHDKSTTNMKRE